MPHFYQFEPRLLLLQGEKQVIAHGAQELNAFPSNFLVPADIDSGVQDLVSGIEDVIKQHVPMSKLALFHVLMWSDTLN